MKPENTIPDDTTLIKDILNLTLQVKVITNTYLTKNIFSKYKPEKNQRKKLSDKIRYLVKKLERKGILRIKRISKRLYEIEPLDRKKALDLITRPPARNQAEKPLQHEQPAEKHDFWQLSADALAPRYRRQHNIWRNAANQFWLKPKLSRDEQEELRDYFDDWKDDVGQRILLFKDAEGEFQIKRYKTRFTAKEEALTILKTAEETFKNAIQQYDKAVFLTVTLPPIFPLKLGLYILSFIFHRIKAFLRKQHGESLPHFKVPEPQRSFNPHIHVVIFGTNFIMEKRKFTKWLDKQLESFLSRLGDHYHKTINRRATEEQIKALNKLGKRLIRKYKRYKKKKPEYEGLVNWLTSIRVEGEKAKFENPPPDYKKKGLMEHSVWDYIKFYMLSAIMEAAEDDKTLILDDKKSKNKPKKQIQITFYWLFRLPFWTASPKIRVKRERPPPSGWQFLTSLYEWQLEWWDVSISESFPKVEIEFGADLA